MSEWIKRSDKLPDDGQCVIATGFLYGKKENGRWVEPSVFADGEFHPCSSNDDGDLVADFNADMNKTTHWQPLPPAPAE